MYSGMSVIENFNNWNDLYNKDKRVLANPDFFPNQCLVLKNEEPKGKDHAIVKNGQIIPIKNYNPMKVKAVNSEQTLALELLRDDTIPLVTLLGAAGSGKTFLACAHMLHALNKGSIQKIIIAKNLSPVGREIGHLPRNG